MATKKKTKRKPAKRVGVRRDGRRTKPLDLVDRVAAALFSFWIDQINSHNADKLVERAEITWRKDATYVRDIWRERARKVIGKGK